MLRILLVYFFLYDGVYVCVDYGVWVGCGVFGDCQGCFFKLVDVDCIYVGFVYQGVFGGVQWFQGCELNV